MVATECEHRIFTGIRSCPLCGASSARAILCVQAGQGTASYDILECTECGLRYLSPLPSGADLIALYGEEYYGAKVTRLLSWNSLRMLLHHIVLRERQRALLGRAPGRILDVGCGDGDFLAALKKKGWDVHGIEFSPAAAAIAQEKGVDVYQGELASAHFSDGSFDVVTFWHVLEHLTEPLIELAETRRLLRDDGLLIVEVPNSASVTFQLCREHWFPLSVPRHFQHFTPTTLRLLLEKAGFVPVRRRDFHLLDFLLAFMSFMGYLGVLDGADGTHYFVSDYRKANWRRRLMFLALGIPICVLAFPYSVITTILTRSGETVTFTARKLT